MDNPDPNPAPEEAVPVEEVVPITMAEFLQAVPPDVTKFVSDAVQWRQTNQGLSTYPLVAAPILQMHCEHEVCNGIRTFMSTGDVVVRSAYQYVTYRCENCKKKYRTFALLITLRQGSPRALLQKLGER
jgi:hypothetical protein